MRSVVLIAVMLGAVMLGAAALYIPLAVRLQRLSRCRGLDADDDAKLTGSHCGQRLFSIGQRRW